MASVLEMILAAMSTEDEKKAFVQKILASNPDIFTEDSEASKLLAIYRGEGETPEQKAAREKAEKEAADAAARQSQADADKAARDAAAKAAAGGGSGDSSVAVLAELRKLNETIAAQQATITTLQSKAITEEKLNELGGKLAKSILGTAIERADEVNVIRETHRREFGEELDRSKFEEFAKKGEDPTTHVSKYRSITEAYNDYVGERRIQAKIDKGVADGVKQKLSGQEVPGSTQQVALSPAQQVMKKASEAANNTNGKPSAMVAAERLKNLVRQREESGTVN